MEEFKYETVSVLDEDEDTGETLYSVRIFTGDVVSIIVDADGTEYFNDDWQGKQPQSFEDLRENFDLMRWYTGDQIDF